MKSASLDKLQAELAKPGFERELIPLLMYKGRADLGRAQRMWNLTVAMMMHEAESISEGIHHLHMNPDWSHLCYPEKRLQATSMYSFLSRMKDNPGVTALVPGLTDYVDWVLPWYRTFKLQRVPLEATRSRRAWWREWTPKQRERMPVPLDFPALAPATPAYDLCDHYGVSRGTIYRWCEEAGVRCLDGRSLRQRLPPPADFYEMANGRSVLWASKHYERSPIVISRWFKETKAEKAPRESSSVLAYPFLLHEAKRPEHDLLRLINSAVPEYLPPDLRADMCQDLAVGILTGEFRKDDLHLPAQEVVKRVYRMFPTKYGPLSLDAPLTSDGEFSLLDTLVDEGRDWA